MKGYIHQGNHTPTCFQAESIRLYITVCGKGQLGMITKVIAHTFDLILPSMLTFSENVFHDGLEFAGTDLHVLMKGWTICCTLAQMYTLIYACPVSTSLNYQVTVTVWSLSDACLVSLCTHFSSNLLVNGSELFFFLSFHLRLEQFSLRDKKEIIKTI